MYGQTHNSVENSVHRKARRMSPIDALKSGFRQYFGFSGRVTRSEFWWWFVFSIPVYALLFVVNTYSPGTASVIAPPLIFGLLLPTVAVAIRRLHDRGQSGWYLLIALIPYFGVTALMVDLALPGNPTADMYDSAPGATSVAPLPVGRVSQVLPAEGGRRSAWQTVVGILAILWAVPGGFVWFVAVWAIETDSPTSSSIAQANLVSVAYFLGLVGLIVWWQALRRSNR